MLRCHSDHDTGLHEGGVDLADGVDEAGISVGEVSLYSDFPVLANGRGHDFFQTRVDNVDFISTFNLTGLGFESHELEELGLGLLLIFLGKTAWGNVVQVLEPLEVRAGDTTAIDKHVWGGDDSSADENLLGGVGRRSVGTLEDGIDLDVLSVASVKGFLSSGGDHAVGLLEEEGLWVLADGLSGIRVGCESSVLNHEVLNLLNVKTVRVVDSRVVLNDGRDFATILLDEFGCPVADGTESLDNEGLVLDAEGKVDAVGEGLGIEEFTHGVVDTETSGLGAAGDTSLGDKLTSAAALSVDIGLTTDVHVGVLDPGHSLLVGTHVRSEAVNLCTDEALLDELHSVLTGDSLDLMLGVLARINLDTTLGTAEGYVSNGELEGHQGREGLNFLQINVLRVTSATLDRQLVGRVLGSIKNNSKESCEFRDF